MTGRPHDWMLVGPWYRWLEPGVPASGRVSSPVFQKYAGADFINDFLAEPQRSLKFRDEDHVHQVNRPPLSSLFGLTTRRWVKTGLRKIFLDTHSRFYLVVCELHCDAPGFPSVDREAACEAGFVVRRQTAAAPPAVESEIVRALAAKAAARARLQEIQRLATRGRGGPAAARAATGPLLGEALANSQRRYLEQAAGELARESERLLGLLQGGEVEYTLEGWKPSQHEGVGAWGEVEETPAEILAEEGEGEAVHPLYPLVPDPEGESDSALGRTLFFGVLPTNGSEVDEAGYPRFDDRSLYEVRCFVRRHREGCARTTTRGDCHGELVWSAPTSSYQLAPPLDLDGTSNRPITIQMPDLDALAAQADGLTFGEGVGVRMVSPANSSLEITDDEDPIGGQVGGSAICFFAIPLLTIVARFVFSLFLPVVVFLFGLWFLLRLKFCIPPSLSISAGLAAQIDADLQAGLDLDVSLDLNLKTELRASFGASMAQSTLEIEDSDYPSMDELGELALDISADFSADAPPELAEDFDEPPTDAYSNPGTLPAVTARLEYYDVLPVPA